MKTVLFNPFKRYQENHLFLLGIAVTLLGSYLGYLFNVRFDGVLDVHFANSTSSWQPALDNLIDSYILAILLYALGMYINNKTRFIDILNITLISRIPFYLITFFNVGGAMERINSEVLNTLRTEQIPDFSTLPLNSVLTLGIFALISLLFIIWSISLLFNGFKIATNAKSTVHIILFFTLIIIAEILSKLFLNTLTNS
ncbi:hypothetical protein [Cellulophaga sp. E6(2014)]|uniref:hypothetical protein n=1 Tax=Cellulophaga sp. E6(2014) TaxID=1495334 RepID=UPI00051D391E|nr:hypothetical protein [Cellulophaga sp. E6(2014)]KGK31051.1 hypothetical protein EL45_07400 [Cellulophaga sp. E6(2014)]